MKLNFRCFKFARKSFSLEETDIWKSYITSHANVAKTLLVSIIITKLHLQHFGFFPHSVKRFLVEKSFFKYICKAKVSNDVKVFSSFLYLEYVINMSTTIMVFTYIR